MPTLVGSRPLDSDIDDITVQPTRKQAATVPTGVAIRDPREQLFDAAERILLRAGPSALTSRAVTTEAGCAKGVLHRHFPDFDAFLADLVRNRISRVETQATALLAAAGTGTVTDQLAAALIEVYSSVAVAVISLLTFRDDLRARLRQDQPAGVPLLAEATAMLTAYLRAERDLGRIAAHADVDTLALMLIGTGHLLFAGQGAGGVEADAVRNMVSTVMAGVLP